MSGRPTQTPRALSTTQYVRRARRVRSVFARDPQKMHAALSTLARQHTAAAVRDDRSTPVINTTPDSGQVAQFARSVEEKLEGSLLRYSCRTALIQNAQQRGIGRFEANLVIAAVMHRHARVQPASTQASNNRVFPRISPGWAMFLIVQSAIALGAWVVVR